MRLGELGNEAKAGAWKLGYRRDLEMRLGEEPGNGARGGAWE